MTDEQLLQITKNLVAIDSSSNNSKGLREAYEFMAEYLLNSGKDITLEAFESGGRPSLLAYKGNVRPEKFHLILNGHLDVVPGKPEQYEATIQDGKLYGRGVYDMKAAAVVMTDVFCEFVDKVPYALGLQLVTDEENAGKHGTLYQVQQGVRSDFVICGECGRVPSKYEIANEAKGIIVAEISLRGNSAHGAYPWNGDNAALRALQFIHKLHEHYPTPEEETPNSTATVTSVTATSDAHTKIPDRAIVKLDVRYTPNDTKLREKQKFIDFIKSLDESAEIVMFHDFSSPLKSDPSNPLLLALKASAERVEGAPFSLVTRNATSDGRFYGDVGNAACEFGIAGEHQHGDGEYITLKAFSNYHETLRDFLATRAQEAATPILPAVEVEMAEAH
jgi:succinyl-diaminopimelate desuccinylase